MTWAADITARGEVVGSYRIDSQPFHGFLLTPDGAVSAIDVPGAIATRPASINAVGDVVGFFRDEQRRIHGFLLSRRDAPTL